MEFYHAVKTLSHKHLVKPSCPFTLHPKPSHSFTLIIKTLTRGHNKVVKSWNVVQMQNYLRFFVFGQDAGSTGILAGVDHKWTTASWPQHPLQRCSWSFYPAEEDPVISLFFFDHKPPAHIRGSVYNLWVVAKRCGSPLHSEKDQHGWRIEIPNFNPHKAVWVLNCNNCPISVAPIAILK